jgi:hypothetical protein
MAGEPARSFIFRLSGRVAAPTLVEGRLANKDNAIMRTVLKWFPGDRLELSNTIELHATGGERPSAFNIKMPPQNPLRNFWLFRELPSYSLPPTAISNGTPHYYHYEQML